MGLVRYLELATEVILEPTSPIYMRGEGKVSPCILSHQKRPRWSGYHLRGTSRGLGLCGPKDVLQDAFVPKCVDDKKGIPFPLGPTPGPITLLCVVQLLEGPLELTVSLS